MSSRRLLKKTSSTQFNVVKTILPLIAWDTRHHEMLQKAYTNSLEVAAKTGEMKEFLALIMIVDKVECKKENEVQHGGCD